MTPSARTALIDQLALKYHKSMDGEGEYGCPGLTCPGVKRLAAFLTEALSALTATSSPSADAASQSGGDVMCDGNNECFRLSAELEQLRADAAWRHEWHARLGRGSKTEGAFYESLADAASLRRHVEELEEALEKSIHIQSHYAKLLNMHDGGRRIEFATAAEWIARLRVLAVTADPPVLTSE